MFEFDGKRLEKLEALRAAGVDPYPHGLRVTHTLAAVAELAGERPGEELAADPTEVQIAGRVLFKNEMGKAGFARLQDRSGRMQVYLRKDEIGEDAFRDIWKKLDLGDHIWGRGRLMRTKTGETSVHLSELRLAAKCINSLPDKHKGLHDPEFRNRHRYVDLFVNEESREVFLRRSRIVRAIRNFFEARDFVEVETPMMQVIPGGATARPFITHHNALDIDLYLRIAPELYLKRLVVGGLERVYEINRNFRNEGVDTKHNPEFTMLEFYQAWATWEDLMDLSEALLREVANVATGSTSVTFGPHTLDFAAPFERLSMTDGIVRYAGLRPEQALDTDALRERWLSEFPKDAKNPRLPQTLGKWYEWYFDQFVEPNLIQPTFITRFPAEISPLSRKNSTDPLWVDRFELFVAGMELANGFNELNDPVDQQERFQNQVAAREGGDDEAMHLDADFIEALTYGMPPTAGEGIGIDRLVMLLSGQTSIRDVILFPTLRPDRGGAQAPAEGSPQGKPTE